MCYDNSSIGAVLSTLFVQLALLASSAFLCFPLCLGLWPDLSWWSSQLAVSFGSFWVGRQQESVPFVAPANPSEVSRRRPLPAGAFNASQTDFDGAWEKSLQVRDRVVRGSSSAQSYDVVTPLSLRW